MNWLADVLDGGDVRLRRLRIVEFEASRACNGANRNCDFHVDL